jgi:hypothetical protein
MIQIFQVCLKDWHFKYFEYMELVKILLYKINFKYENGFVQPFHVAYNCMLRELSFNTIHVHDLYRLVQSHNKRLFAFLIPLLEHICCIMIPAFSQLRGSTPQELTLHIKGLQILRWKYMFTSRKRSRKKVPFLIVCFFRLHSGHIVKTHHNSRPGSQGDYEHNSVGNQETNGQRN